MVFSLIYVCAILILAVGSCLFGFNLPNSENVCSLRDQVRTYTLDTLPFDYRILWNAGEYINWMTCVNSRPNTAQADFSSRKWWLPLASQSQRRRRAPLHGSLLVGSFHQSSSVTNTGKNTFPGSVIITIIIITIILCVMNVFVLGADGFHPAHSGLQHWTDLQPLVPPCHRFNPLESSLKLQCCKCSRI